MLSCVFTYPSSSFISPSSLQRACHVLSISEYGATLQIFSTSISEISEEHEVPNNGIPDTLLQSLVHPPIVLTWGMTTTRVSLMQPFRWLLDITSARCATSDPKYRTVTLPPPLTCPVTLSSHFLSFLTGPTSCAI